MPLKVYVYTEEVILFSICMCPEEQDLKAKTSI